MYNVKTSLYIKPKHLIIIYTMGFILGIFFTKNFVLEMKNDTKKYDYIMFQFYCSAAFGYRFRFILFLLIGPIILLCLFNVLA